MEEFKKTVLKHLCMLNRLAIIVLTAFGTDAISNKYDFPWQIIFFIVSGLFAYDISSNKKRAKKELQDKIHSFIEKNKSLNLTPSQSMEMQSWYK